MECKRPEYLPIYIAIHTIGIAALALAFSQETRLKALKRANYQCEDCDKPLRPGDRKVHHIVPQHVKIDDSLENAAALCLACERQRHYERYLIYKSPHDLNASRPPREKGSPKAGKNRYR